MASSNKANFKRVQNAEPSKSKPARGWKYAKADATTASNNHSEDADVVTCLICANSMKYAALSPCNHTTCYMCAYKQRALYERKACLVCRTENNYVIFTKELDCSYSQIGSNDIVATDERYGVKFTSNSVRDATFRLLKYYCPFGDLGDSELGDFKSFSAHLKNEHKRVVCNICQQNKKIFPFELQIMTPNQLKNHHSVGDKNGFKGHPLCGFCSGQRFYSDDELYIHMRERHEKCHICDQIDPTQPQYFRNYEDLFKHFKHSHYICNVKSCLDSKFVVFRDDLDLQAHILKEHANLTGNKGNLSLTNNRRYRSELSSTFTPNVSTAVFGNQSLSSRSFDLPSTQEEESPELKVKRMEERARHYLNYSQTKMKTFQDINQDFRNNALNAKSVKARYEQLFREPDSDIFLLLRNFAETFPEGSSKHRELNSIYLEEQERRDRQAKFPSLSSNPWEHATPVGASWGKNSSTSRSASASRYNFPSLAEVVPPSPPPMLPKNQASISRSSLNSKSSLSLVSPAVKKPKANVEYTPTYLKNKRKNEASSSNSELFPPLPTTSGRSHTPVNQHLIVDPKQWGKNRKTTTSGSSSSENLSNLAPRRKGKGKEVLFHVGR